MVCVASGGSCGGSGVSGCVVEWWKEVRGYSNFSMMSSSVEVGVVVVESAAVGR